MKTQAEVEDLVERTRKETEAVAYKIIRSLEDRINDLERTIEGYQVHENELRKANIALKERLIELGVDYRELI